MSGSAPLQLPRTPSPWWSVAFAGATCVCCGLLDQTALPSSTLGKAAATFDLCNVHLHVHVMCISTHTHSFVIFRPTGPRHLVCFSFPSRWIMCAHAECEHFLSVFCDEP